MRMREVGSREMLSAYYLFRLLIYIFPVYYFLDIPISKLKLLGIIGLIELRNR